MTDEMEVKTSQDYIEEFFNMDDEEASQDLGDSEITTFFDGIHVFLTGGSGFIGKLLVEKLLRCTNIAKLYMLLRPKKGKTIEQRFNEHFDDLLYERLKREKPNFHDKIVVVNGETGAPDLGISPEDRQMLRENTNVIFHGAANVRFDEKLRTVIETNVRGTKLLMEFAKEMKNFKAFVHISTAFSHCTFKFIEEKFYAPPLEAEKVLQLLELLNDDALERVTPSILGNFPNTYAFSKAVAEDAVQRNSHGLPTCVVRPSIVTSTYKDPVAGWINNLYGATGVVVGAGIGLLKVLYCEGNKIADIIPGDYVINNIIAAAWDLGKTWEAKKQSEKNKQVVKHDDPVIYNCVSSCQNPITWATFMHLNAIYGIDVPSRVAIWYYFFMLERRKWLYNVYVFFLHLIPGVLVDLAAILTGRKPILLKAYRKIHKFSGVISYFCTQQWKFTNDEVTKLWDKLTPIDKIRYDFMVSNVDWDLYFQHHIKGLRVFLIKDPMETMEAAKHHYRRLKYAHYTLLTLTYIVFACSVAYALYFILWLTYSMFAFLWNYYS